MPTPTIEDVLENVDDAFSQIERWTREDSNHRATANKLAENMVAFVRAYRIAAGHLAPK